MLVMTNQSLWWRIACVEEIYVRNCLFANCAVLPCWQQMPFYVNILKLYKILSHAPLVFHSFNAKRSWRHSLLCDGFHAFNKMIPNVAWTILTCEPNTSTQPWLLSINRIFPAVVSLNTEYISSKPFMNSACVRSCHYSHILFSASLAGRSDFKRFAFKWLHLFLFLWICPLLVVNS